MRMNKQSRNLLPLAATLAACVVSFTLGYVVRALRDTPINESATSQLGPAAISSNEESRSHSTDSSEYDSLLATIERAIDPDNWLAVGGTNTIEPLPSNIVACTPEDIFGSREAYLKIFDDSNGEVATENDPSVVTERDDPFKTSEDH